MYVNTVIIISTQNDNHCNNTFFHEDFTQEMQVGTKFVLSGPVLRFVSDESVSRKSDERRIEISERL
jgi:hypothetical protein